MSSTSPVNKYLNMYTFPCHNNNDYKLTAVLGNYRAFLKIQIYICESFMKTYPKNELIDLGAARQKNNIVGQLWKQLITTHIHVLVFVEQ